MTKVSPGRVFAFHLMAIAALGLAFAMVVTADRLGHPTLMGFSDLFRLQREGNAPSFFSALALIVAALAANANRSMLPKLDSERGTWAIIACVFTFMAVDEAIQLHEMIKLPNRIQRLSPYLYYAGVFPYLLLSIWLAIRLFPFWRNQSFPVRTGFAVGGVLYVFAAIGMELVESDYASAHLSEHSLRMSIGFAFEELGEMVAVAIFLRTFLTRLVELGGGLLLPLVVEREEERETANDAAPNQISPASR